MKKLICVILILCLIPVFALADGFSMTVPEFIKKYNAYSSDKPIEDISSGTVFGEGDAQYIRLKADDGVEIFLRYADSVESELSGIIIMQQETSTDFEKLLSVATSATYVLSGKFTDLRSAYYQHYQVICEAISYYGYSGNSVPVSVEGYSVEYQVEDGTRQLYIIPKDDK